MQKSRVVIDTSILISAFVFGGRPQIAIRKAFSIAEIYVSQEILKEYRETPRELEKEGKITSYQFEILVEDIATFASRSLIVYPEKRLQICADYEDDMFLECCLESEADYLITGDKKLLQIKITELPNELQKLKIVNPTQFLELT